MSELGFAIECRELWDLFPWRVNESGPLRAVHLSRHELPGGLVNQGICCPLIQAETPCFWCSASQHGLLESSSSLSLLSLELSDTKVYGPEIRARIGTAAHFCKAVVLKFAHVTPHIQLQSMSEINGLSHVSLHSHIDNFLEGLTLAKTNRLAVHC